MDEHTMDIAADADEVWPALSEALVRAFSGAGSVGYARVVGCTERAVSGPRLLVEGSTLPGFRVVASVPESELVLAGRHRFSCYVLVFRLEQVGPGRSRLRAQSCANFPGATGGVYRLLVVGTGFHALAVRRLLSGIKRQAELRARSR